MDHVYEGHLMRISHAFFLLVVSTVTMYVAVQFAVADKAKSIQQEPMTFKIIENPHCENCVVVFADGEISDTTIDRFQTTLDHLEKSTNWSRDNARKGLGPHFILLLDSLGGLASPAYSVSRQARIYGAITVVARPSVTVEIDGALDPSSCNSACSLILMGGKQRFSHIFSNIGLHQIYPLVKDKRNFTRSEVLQYLSFFKEGSADLARHISEMEMDQRIFLIAMQQTEDEFHFLSASEAISLKLINANVDSLVGIDHRS
ncbi:hypothetical protein FJ970_21920 [Mesorhizobium sp. B2-1-8]|uniref:hypothetical protein n=2 Tax=unclassified Mesorhizobium TaxID=325217 RepID=UPI00112CFAAA|nr:hypothetical protein [Mesorhizobium sp. B2-1-8]UCI17748.1 hypothetical protein FJ970_21920 [Mesorhizobium sp. B2-1-8]